jgi:hypothetical protein
LIGRWVQRCSQPWWSAWNDAREKTFRPLKLLSSSVCRAFWIYFTTAFHFDPLDIVWHLIEKVDARPLNRGWSMIALKYATAWTSSHLTPVDGRSVNTALQLQTRLTDIQSVFSWGWPAATSCGISLFAHRTEAFAPFCMLLLPGKNPLNADPAHQNTQLRELCPWCFRSVRSRHSSARSCTYHFQVQPRVPTLPKLV